MADWKKHFEGKKITVMGLGLLGRAVGDAKFLAQNGAVLIVTDLKSNDELRASLKVLEPYPNVKYRLGGHDTADFKNRDYILKAAGVPFDSPYIEEAKKNGIPVKMSASWFAALSRVPVVAVTGTRGKSTVTAMLHDVMKKADMNVLLGGNVRGVSTLALLPQVGPDSIALMELDSWQARGFGDEKMSPQVAMFTTFFDDHLNYYLRASEGSMQAGLHASERAMTESPAYLRASERSSKNGFDTSERALKASLAYRGARKHYLDDKAQIFLHQESSDTLVAPKDVARILKDTYGSHIRSKLVIADEKPFPQGWILPVPGAHNVLNAQCALAAARALGVDDALTKQALAEFKGVPGRLELIREINGIKIYNDTTATTPEATLAGLSALQPSTSNLPPRIILILGGADKGLIMDSVVEEAKKRAKKIIFLSGSGTDKIKNEFPEAPIYERLDVALRDAVDSSREGDTILFSPAFASFGMFKNEFDRGDQFVSLVKAL